MNNIEERIPRKEDRSFCVKIGKIERENLYEMVRKYWKAKLDRVSKSTHVLAIKNGIVVAVYAPEKWFYTKEPKWEGRVEFIGELDLDNEYIGKSVKSLLGNSRKEFRYINL